MKQELMKGHPPPTRTLLGSLNTLTVNSWKGDFMSQYQREGIYSCKEQSPESYSREECSQKKAKKSQAESLEDITKKVLEQFIHAPDHKVNRKSLIKKLKLCRRRMYDILMVSVCLGILHYHNNNQYEFQGLNNLKSLVEKYTEREASGHFLAIHGKKESEVQRMACNIMSFILMKKQGATIQEVSLGMGQHFDSQKTRMRRIYDILNILMGFNLISRQRAQKSTTTYRWEGVHHLENLITGVKQKFEHSKKSKYLPKEIEGLSELNGRQRYLPDCTLVKIESEWMPLSEGLIVPPALGQNMLHSFPIAYSPYQNSLFFQHFNFNIFSNIQKQNIWNI